MKLGTLTATGKPVELTRFTGAFHLVVLQLTAETGYVQVGAAELLRILLHPEPVIGEKSIEERPTGESSEELSSLLDADDQAVAALSRHLAARTKELDRLRIENARLRQARKVALATSETPKP